jgi:HEAT repeat protein
LPAHPDAAPDLPLDTEAVTPRLPRGQLAALTEQSAVVRNAWRGGNSVDPRPTDPRTAAEELAHADDRDAAFGALLRGVSSRAGYAAVLIVQGELAYGRLAMTAGELDPGVMQVAIPVERVPAFRSAITTRSPYIGTVGTGEVATDAMVARLGQRLPPSALVMPIAIRDRVVALVYAHRGAEPISIAEVAEVLPLATEAAVALSRLILRAKSEGYRKERGASESDLARAEVPVKTRPDVDGPWAKPVAPPVPVSLAHDDTEVAVPPLPQATRKPIEQILDAIEQGGIGAAEAMDEAVRRADEVLPRLGGRLPGRLWIDRYSAAARQTRASQHGPLLALTVRLGERAVPLIGQLLTDGRNDRDLKYYATLACTEVHAPALAMALATRLFDPDHGVRAAAIDALLGYNPREIDGALTTVRSSLFGRPEQARTAAYALGELRDVLAIPSLIDLLSEATVAEDARRALIAITKQDFGTRARKWRSWWDRNQERPRMEWLLDGLAHTEDNVRLAAADELMRVTGEHFGYRHDSPRAQREEARNRWLAWWDETGRARFLARDEKNRPTAILPDRR